MTQRLWGILKYFGCGVFCGLYAPSSLIAGNPILKADVFFQNGQVYLRVQQYDKAIAAFTTAIQLHPRHDRAYHQRGSAYYYLKEYSKACENWNKACLLNHACIGWNFGKYQKLCGPSTTEVSHSPDDLKAPTDSKVLPTTLE